MQKLADGHDTPIKKSPLVAGGLVVVMVDQVEPFHRSASVWYSPPVYVRPTATQNAVDVHDTPVSSVSAAGLVVVMVDQVEPFHRSASVWNSAPPLIAREPTPTQNAVDVQKTPCRR
jgi:hypothetical protein